MLVIDKEGWVNSSKITKEHRGAIEHLPMSIVNAVVLHRTDSSTASAVLNAWKTKKEGTHFLISEDGTIFQTASVKKQCWHVGKLYARCSITSSCTEADAKAMEVILHKKNINWGQKFKLITRSELKKSYPERFPHNHDSLGIEIVGMTKNGTEIYESPNKLQMDSIFWLLDEIVSTYQVSLKDIYAHGEIAHKIPSEGLATLKSYTLHKQGK